MITINITNGATLTAKWKKGMNVQQAMEGATYIPPSTPKLPNPQPKPFLYSIEYFGPKLGYLVEMIFGTYESFVYSPEAPYFYWELLVNGRVSPTGIDTTILNQNDVVTFTFLTYLGTAHHAGSTIHEKISRLRVQDLQLS